MYVHLWFLLLIVQCTYSLHAKQSLKKMYVRLLSQFLIVHTVFM